MAIVAIATAIAIAGKAIRTTVDKFAAFRFYHLWSHVHYNADTELGIPNVKPYVAGDVTLLNCAVLKFTLVSFSLLLVWGPLVPHTL
jgi:hypothetical protein